MNEIFSYGGIEVISFDIVNNGSQYQWVLTDNGKFAETRIVRIEDVIDGKGALYLAQFVVDYMKRRIP